MSNANASQVFYLMLTPLDTLQRNPLLHQLPQRTHMPQIRHPIPNRIQHVIDLALGSKTSDTEPDATMCAFVTVPQSLEHIARLERGRGACRAGRESDVFESHEEGFAFDVGEGNVDAAWVEMVGGSVLGSVFHREEAVQEAS